MAGPDTGSVVVLLVLLAVGALLALGLGVIARAWLLPGLSFGQRSAVEPCPHLGLAQDPLSREELPSEDHRCYFEMQRERIDLAHQQTFCLSGQYRRCPWLAMVAARVERTDDGYWGWPKRLAAEVLAAVTSSSTLSTGAPDLSRVRWAEALDVDSHAWPQVVVEALRVALQLEARGWRGWRRAAFVWLQVVAACLVILVWRACLWLARWSRPRLLRLWEVAVRLASERGVPAARSAREAAAGQGVAVVHRAREAAARLSLRRRRVPEPAPGPAVEPLTEPAPALAAERPAEPAPRPAAELLVEPLEAAPAVAAKTAPLGLVEHGLAALEAGQDDEAYELFVQACRADRENARAWFLRAKTAPTLSEVVASLEHAARLEPDNPQVRVNLDWAHWRVEREQTARALEQAVPATAGPGVARRSNTFWRRLGLAAFALVGLVNRCVVSAACLVLAALWMAGAAPAPIVEQLVAVDAATLQRLPQLDVATLRDRSPVDLSLGGYDIWMAVPYVLGFLALSAAIGLLRREDWARWWAPLVAVVSAALWLNFGSASSVVSSHLLLWLCTLVALAGPLTPAQRTSG